MSKRVVNHPPVDPNAPVYWRSLEERADDPQFKSWLEREFPQGSSEMAVSEVSRRSFVRLMGASAALAGLSMSACRREEKALVPFTQGVEWSIPGKSLYFTAAMPTRRGALPVLVETHDGRPTKIEGNPMHPSSKGGTDLFAQASLLDLYDPDRARGFLKHGQTATESEFVAWLKETLSHAGSGEKMAVLAERNYSPSRLRLRKEIEAKFPNLLWAEYEPLSRADYRAVSDAVFGEGVRYFPEISKADVILAIDSDFLGTDEGSVAMSREFANRRNPEPGGTMNRLYVAENRYTITGGMADHRVRVRASEAGAFAREVALEIASLTRDANLKSIAEAYPAAPVKVPEGWVRECAKDLFAHKGSALVLTTYRQSAATQALVVAINAALGGLGKTLVGRASKQPGSRSIEALGAAMEHGKVETLFILGGNPAYNAPADVLWVTRQAKVKQVVRFGYHADETTTLGCLWHVPAAHYLEAWGDNRAADGSYVLSQPMILPLFGGWSELDLLSQIARDARPQGPALVQETFKEELKKVSGGGEFEVLWPKSLHDGFLNGTAAATVPLTFDAAKAKAIAATAKPVTSKWEVVFAADYSVDDGRYANNAWVQEMPDPVTKVTWDNAALISPRSLAEWNQESGHNLATGDTIRVSTKAGMIEIPLMVAPGHADNSITIALGYGRAFEGGVCYRQQTPTYFGSGFSTWTTVGTNVYPLRGGTELYVAGAEISKWENPDGRKYQFAITQEHGALEGRGPDIFREATVAQYRGHEVDLYAPHHSVDAETPKKNGKLHLPSLYTHPPLDNVNQWGMAVDLNRCTGCSVCMVACQSENNIPIVGKEQVIAGREMHWIRTDRYFVSHPNNREETKEKKFSLTAVEDTDNPRMVYQPMMCQHCEKAPCETVCPVNATVHSDDGLNVMAYNRCIGTRYCANNCPFKVRRFNFFDFNMRPRGDIRDPKGHTFYTWNAVSDSSMADTLKLSKNPDVTVRMRGVMEKCTFCVQRIQEAKIAAKVHAKDSANVKVPTDSFKVACQQACPTEAIVFGDINDAESRLGKLLKSERGYRLLEYLNIAARVKYLARISNPNPKMPGAEIWEVHHAATGAEKAIEHATATKPEGGNA